MNIGDRVRMIKGHQEGIVKKILDDKLVEISTEDGFDIPVLKQDLALVSREESIYFEGALREKEENNPLVQKKPIAEIGLFLAFELLEKNELRFWIINNTDFNCPFSISENRIDSRLGITAGFLLAKSQESITTLKLAEIDKWPEFEIAILFARKGEHKILAPFLKTYKFRSRRFFKSPTMIPIINREGYYFQIDQESSEIDADVLKNEMAENIEKKTGYNEHQISGKMSKEIDLHFEVLWPESQNMGSGDKLNLQLEHFEKSLDRAIYLGMSEITFIHGVGNGKLKTEIHRSLSRNTLIKSFKDAQKEKFGYGATLVKIK